MRLTVISAYGARETIVSEQATPEIVEATIRSVNWSGFHQVVLEDDMGNWFEVGSSFGDDGLSASFGEAGDEYVIAILPTTVDEMVRLQALFVSDSAQWRNECQWHA